MLFPQIRLGYGRFNSLFIWKFDDNSDFNDDPVYDDQVDRALLGLAEEHEAAARKYRGYIALIDKYGVDRIYLARRRKLLGGWNMTKKDKRILDSLEEVT